MTQEKAPEKQEVAEETPKAEEQAPQVVAALVPGDLYDAISRYMLSKPMGEVEQLVNGMRSVVTPITAEQLKKLEGDNDKEG